MSTLKLPSRGEIVFVALMLVLATVIGYAILAGADAQRGPLDQATRAAEEHYARIDAENVLPEPDLPPAELARATRRVAALGAGRIESGSKRNDAQVFQRATEDLTPQLAKALADGQLAPAERRELQGATDDLAAAHADNGAMRSVLGAVGRLGPEPGSRDEMLDSLAAMARQTAIPNEEADVELKATAERMAGLLAAMVDNKHDLDTLVTLAEEAESESKEFNRRANELAASGRLQATVIPAVIVMRQGLITMAALQDQLLVDGPEAERASFSVFGPPHVLMVGDGLAKSSFSFGWRLAQTSEEAADAAESEAPQEERRKRYSKRKKVARGFFHAVQACAIVAAAAQPVLAATPVVVVKVPILAAVFVALSQLHNAYPWLPKPIDLGLGKGDKDKEGGDQQGGEEAGDNEAGGEGSGANEASADGEAASPGEAKDAQTESPAETKETEGGEPADSNAEGETASDAEEQAAAWAGDAKDEPLGDANRRQAVGALVEHALKQSNATDKPALQAKIEAKVMQRKPANVLQAAQLVARALTEEGVVSTASDAAAIRFNDPQNAE